SRRAATRSITSSRWRSSAAYWKRTRVNSEELPVKTTLATHAPRASRLAGVITAALLRLGVEREVTTGTDTVTIGDIVLQWTEAWTELRSGGGERRSGQAGWEVRLLPSALPSGYIHNDWRGCKQAVG